VTRAMAQHHEIPYEKLIIGPLTTVGEMAMGGHWLEMLKVQRQAGTYPSYVAAARHMWQELGFLSFYKGFWPYGVFQGMYKGLPVIFVQGEAKHKLVEAGMDAKRAGVVAGVTAGMVQGAMVAPTQRLKTIVGTNLAAGAVSTDLIAKVVREEGFMTIFKGTTVMVVRRGVDWGLRFYAKGLSDRFFLSLKADDQPKKLTAAESFASGIFGGAFSGINQPLDVWLANSQKHRDKPVSVFGAFGELVKESQTRGFFPVWYRGVGMRIIHSSYHTAWMAGLGSYIADVYRASK